MHPGVFLNAGPFINGYFGVSGYLFFAIIAFSVCSVTCFSFSVLLHTARDGVRYILLLVCTCMHSFVFGGFHCSEYGFWLGKGAYFCVFAWLEKGEIAIGELFCGWLLPIYGRCT
jgi:cytochrome c oxidase subunit IV